MSRLLVRLALKPRKLSPPLARNEFTVTEYDGGRLDGLAVEPHAGDAVALGLRVGS